MNLQHSADRKRFTIVMAGLAALAMLALLTVGQTRAIFSGTTTNDNNTLGTTFVTLNDDDLGTALFNLSGMLPGSTQTENIVISNPSAASMGLRLYGADFFVDDDGDDTTHDPSDIADYLDLLVTIDDGAGGEETVFDGTLAEFAAAADYEDGHWTCSAGLDPDSCPQPLTGAPPPPPAWQGVLETFLRNALDDDVENDEALEDFWTAVRAVDAATRPLQEDPGPAGLYAQIPESVREGLDEGVRTAIEEAVGYEEDTPPPPPAVTTPSERGDLIAAFGDSGSSRTYTFTVTMRADAGSAPNLAPDHRASITFVWEGRA